VQQKVLEVRGGEGIPQAEAGQDVAGLFGRRPGESGVPQGRVGGGAVG
jgi:hypothetical protein